jgi:Tfp pilus assembly protein PilO
MPDRSTLCTYAALSLLGVATALGGWRHVTLLAGARQHLAQVQQDLAAAQADNASVRQAIRQTGNLQAMRESLKQRIPSEPDLGGVLESISRELGQLGVVGQDVGTLPTVPGKRFARVPVALKFRGTLDQAQAALLHLAGLPRLVRVDKLKVEQATDGKPPVIEIEFSAFAQPPEEAPTWAGI